jgi:hypothetical protein
MKLNKKRITSIFALATVILCILSLTISVNGQTSANSDMKVATLTQTKPYRSNSTRQILPSLLATLNSNYSAKVYVPVPAINNNSFNSKSSPGIDLSAYTINLDGEKSNDYFNRSK